MRRTAAAVIAVLGLLLVMPLSAIGGHKPDPDGPPCGDFVDSNEDGVVSAARYDDESETVSARFALAKENCPDYVRYRLYVLDEAGDETFIAKATVKGNPGESFVIFQGVDVSANIDNGEDDNIVCVYAKSLIRRWQNAHVIERAPDHGCVELTTEGTSPGGKFQ